MRRYYKRVHQPMYKDTQTILTTVTLEKLINDITVNVDKSDWPMGVSYKNANCKAGHAKLLHSHTYVQRLRDKITELEASKRNNTKRTQNRTQTHEAPSEDEASSVMPPDMELTAFPDEDYSTSGGGGSKGQKQKRKRNRKRKRNKNNNKGKNAKNRTQSTQEKDEVDPCVKCLNDGLGIVRHTVSAMITNANKPSPL